MGSRLASVVLLCLAFAAAPAQSAQGSDGLLTKTLRERGSFGGGTLELEIRIIYPADLCEGDTIDFRITLKNVSQDRPGPHSGSIENPVPGGTSLEPGSLEGGAVFDATNQRIVWEGPLAVGDSQAIGFALRVDSGLPPGILVLDETLVSAGDVTTGNNVLFRICGEGAGVLLPSDTPPRFGPWLASSEMPGFEAKVLIFPPQGPGRFGDSEPDCIAETLCVSGALEGRPELFVKMVGPRPNGFLWTQISRFTPSRVTLWLRQIPTGLLRLYELDAAGPGEDPDGLQDRQAFFP